MSKTQTQIEKSTEKISMRECRMISNRVGCSRELVRLVVLDKTGTKSRNAKKIIQGAKIIISSRKKLAAKLDAKLLDQE